MLVKDILRSGRRKVREEGNESDGTKFDQDLNKGSFRVSHCSVTSYLK